jgi:hypothetical protein
MQFFIDGVTYKARQMDIFTQMDIVSLLSPLIMVGGAEIVPWLKEMREAAITNGAAGLLDADPTEALKHFGGLTRELAKMSSEDRKTIISACLSHVDRQIKEGQWAPVWVPAARMAAFPELNTNLWLTVRIAFEVIKGQLLPFFTASL